MKTILRLYLIIIVLTSGTSLIAQNIQKKDADKFPSDKNGYQYGYSNESAYLFNKSKIKNLQVWGQNYFDSPSILKKDATGDIIWRKVLVPNGGIWIYQLLLAKDGYIYVAGTLKGNIRLPHPEKKHQKIELKANKDSDEGNPFVLKLNTDGKLLFAVLLANDRDSYRIVNKPELEFNKKSNQLTVKTAIRTGKGEDMPHLFRTYTLNTQTGKVIKADEEGG